MWFFLLSAVVARSCPLILTRIVVCTVFQQNGDKLVKMKIPEIKKLFDRMPTYTHTLFKENARTKSWEAKSLLLFMTEKQIK